MKGVVGILFFLLLCSSTAFGQRLGVGSGDVTECVSYDLLIAGDFISGSTYCAGKCDKDAKDSEDGDCKCFNDTRSGGSCTCTGTGDSNRECVCDDGSGNKMTCKIQNNNCTCSSEGESDDIGCESSLDNDDDCGCSASGEGASCQCTGSGSGQSCTCSSSQDGSTTCELVNGNCQCS